MTNGNTITESPRSIFLQGCAVGELRYQQASDGRAVFYPRLAQPGTGDTNLTWRVSAGTGVVYASTTVRPRGEEPFNVSVVELDEGFRLMTRVIGVAADDIEVGLRVRVEFDDIAKSGTPLPVFQPIDQNASEGVAK